jgi:predicted DNA-binding protein (UPF0251 family)
MMARFNADFWEIPMGSEVLDNVPSEKGLWFETEEDRQRRHALREFFKVALPAVEELIDVHLTTRQREVLRLYYFHDKTQEDIAVILDLSQSTVSRHLFGTVREGKKVGGAIPKLRKVLERGNWAPVEDALSSLEDRFAEAV